VKSSYGDRGPIAALATPRSESALALIRTSGGGPDGEEPGALELLAKVFSPPQKILSAAGNTVVHGWIVDPETGEKLDEVLVSVYRGPRSYTGEDGADISCHGGPAVVRAVLAALRAAGFRDSLPGEFTFRSFMNGKLDLTRCESVMELVSAASDKARRQAVLRLSGALEKEIDAIKTLLVQALSGVEIALDYSEDELSLPNSEGEAALPECALARDRLQSLADSWRAERLYAGGALAVIAGRPNAGKSSLFNALLKEDRSIVTGTPGTTRDWIEAAISVEGIPVRLADTAGLRDLPGPEADAVERIGIERSLELLNEADLVLYVIDGTLGICAEDADYIEGLRESGSSGAKKIPVLRLWNKADIAPPPPGMHPGPEFIAISARTGEGLGDLLRAAALALEEAAGLSGVEGAGIGSGRQKDLVCAALTAVEEALSLAEQGEALDIIAPLLREGVNCLGEITGEVSTAGILETMFSRFCVGK
jgi:tRNA modification GTPase